MNENGTTAEGWKREKHYFRFLRLNGEQAKDLVRLCPDATIRSRAGEAGVLVGSFRLVEGEPYGWITDLVARHRIDEEDYGIFVSLVTEMDTDIIRVPRFVAELYRRTGGVLDFSYTYVSPEEEEDGET